MIAAMVFAQVWGVIQLLALGSAARTIRARTAILALSTGLYACAPFAVLLMAIWTKLASRIMGMPVHSFIEIGAHTVDPYIEEIVKVLPLMLLFLVPTIRRQWSLTDCVLVGAASGSGFGLAEALYRYGASSQAASPIDRGWTLATGVDLPFVPNVWTTITSWLPPGVDSGDIYFPGVSGHPWVNLHLAWSAIGGLAIGLVVLRKEAIARVAGTLLLFYVGTDHAAWNATHSYGSWVRTWLVGPFEAQRNLLLFLPVVALAIAYFLDRKRQQAGDSRELLLTSEVAASPRFVGTLRVAVSRLPWSLLSTAAFVRLRRAYILARSSESEDGSENLRTVVIDAQKRIDLKLALQRPQLSVGKKFRPLGWAKMIISFVLLIPTILYFVVGGWPQTSWLQKVMMGPEIWKIVLPLSVFSQIWLVWQVVASLSLWPKALKLPFGEDATSVGLRIAGGIGSVSLGAFVLLRAIPDFSPVQFIVSNAHVINAIHNLVAGTGLLLSGGGSVLVGGFLGAFQGSFGAADLLDPLNREARYAEQVEAAAKAEWEQALAGSKAAVEDYERARASAAKQEAIRDEKQAAFQEATDARDAAVAAGNQAAIDRANMERSKAQAASQKAYGDLQAAEAAREGAMKAAKDAMKNEAKALDAYKSAAERAAEAKSKYDAAHAKPDKP